MIVIGIDPHKASVTAAALGPTSDVLGHRRLATTAKTAAHLVSWAEAWPERRWAVEGASGLGHGVAQQLVAAGELVVDVPAKLAARARLLGSGSARKTDLADAVSVASVAVHNSKLSTVSAEDHTVVLRLLSDRRDDIVAQRTRTMNRLQVLLRELFPGGAQRGLSAVAAAAFLSRVRPLTPADQLRKQIARDLLDDIRRADRQLKTEQTRIARDMTRAQTRLTAIEGDYATAETNLDKALALVQDCHAAYLSAPDKLRRQFNQAFFERLLIDDTYTVIGQLAQPFETLLGEELRQYVARRNEANLIDADLIDAVEDAFRTEGHDPPPELALASNTPATVHTARGLKEKTMVGAEGLEPPTSAL